ncbi:hypothetical protein H112_04848 [Trichophyton rubrum D6]|uniref:Uncharacterized protein n=3 Tax=Trichophyton TaxID=5550 RepID=A0A178F3R0_TRIRU|nr:hypothetical protein H100_04861 [Trichophyton rubrum MR850]EZF41270.1 hypothetical protein H102_04846 [Trichophyton rubrum CBS 100081]EZF51895.1 hypothetical protein H103_04850 [Trichophyton rubrum CBS 288.86]EZF62481.1 hypothetical protein H104_04842 [Trichophyton rubrum CBS 289.86]EZF73182.1 hypothetical protein H105_04867 [Trichophyton soudanense CBS 452.61]EZF83858.1 hypothetical protein H110_04847 [Trichophyton rubrum MR1448]EZF94586.1 hypothetical protein H113_04890 [Trichophyton rub
MSSDIRHPAGEFQPSRPREEHPGGPKHKPGVKASPADNVPESHAQAVPVGTAPRENLFQPRPNVEDMGGYDEGGASASSTLMGATSADVNKGMGKPLQGETRTEMRHGGEHHRKNPGSGLEGVGANTARTETEMNRLQRE